MTLIATAPDAATFSPFGALIEKPDAAGDRRMFSHWLPPVEGLALQFHLNQVAPSALPFALSQVERHPHAAQAFVPVDVSRYLVTVMPSAADGTPDVAGARCFVLPGNVGVVYRRDVWHAGMTVLDRPGSFAVLMMRGAADDDVMLSVPTMTIAPISSDILRIASTGTDR